MICTICRDADTHLHACPACVADIRRRLREIELYAAWLSLPAMLEPRRGATGRRSPGYGSRPPAREDVLVMLDHRSRMAPAGEEDEPASPWSLLGTLHGLGLYVRSQLLHSGPRTVTVTGEIGYLIAHYDTAAGHPWVAEVAEDIRQLHAQARALAGDLPPRRLGTCLTEGCGGDVYPSPLHRGAASCKRCERPYTGLDLVRLAQEAS